VITRVIARESDRAHLARQPKGPANERHSEGAALTGAGKCEGEPGAGTGGGWRGGGGGGAVKERGASVKTREKDQR